MFLRKNFYASWVIVNFQPFVFAADVCHNNKRVVNFHWGDHEFKMMKKKKKKKRGNVSQLINLSVCMNKTGLVQNALERMRKNMTFFKGN